MQPGVGHFLIFVTDYSGTINDPKLISASYIITDPSGNPFDTIQNAQNYINLIKNKYSEYSIAELCYGPETPIAARTHIEPLQRCQCRGCQNTYNLSQIEPLASGELMCPMCGDRVEEL